MSDRTASVTSNGAPRRGRMWDDLRYLISTFPPGTRSKLWAYCVVQFFISFLDLVGLAAVMPVMQVISGSSLSQGYIGVLHRMLGQPARPTFVVELCALMVLAFASKALFAMTVARWSAGLVARLQVWTGANLLRSYLSESYLVQRRRDVGEVVRTIGTSVGAAHSLVLNGVLNLFSQLLSVVFIIVFLAFVAPGTTLAAVLYFAVVVLVVQRFFGRKNRSAGRRAQDAAAAMSHAMLEAIYAAREVRMHDAEEHFVGDFRRAAEANGIASRNANFYTQAPKYLLEFTTILGIALLLSSAALLGNSQTLMPVLTLFVAAAVKLLPTMTALTVTLGNVRFGQEGLAVTVAALHRTASGAGSGAQQSAAPAPADALGEHGERGVLSVESLRFRYPDGGTDVLSDVSFHVPQGDSLAVCGVSGSGKTTLIDIVLGLLRPAGGHVRYGKLDVADDGAQWRRHVAYVPQDVYLLAAPLWANVAFGLAEADVDKAAVRRCLEQAQLGDLLDRLAGGVDAVVGSKGTQLSGGQKQRVGIARALYRNPAVLVLDEATSALDNETEDKISHVLRALHGEVTTILVAHRLSTVKHVDQILYLENGRIAGAGTFAQLRRLSPAFGRLVQLGRLDDEPEATP